MRRQYQRPHLVEYGMVSELTLGPAGTNPDYDTSGNQINNNCAFPPPPGFTNVFCVNAPVS